ncbi:MAG: bifunctional phosphopantothenoylcysteine decarboxylase/phosphopantothenate--cysteine ligase CoaBC [Mariprofundaceae bacterium]
MFKGKRILIGIGGGIAAYRVAELARSLSKQGASVRCIMTRAACRFVTPLTFESLTGERVYQQLFDLTAEREMGHIRLSRWADVLLVAPATADLLAKFAHGVCDDLLSTLYRAHKGPVVLAPAMNSAMWESPATQRNADSLRQEGVVMIGPDEGDLACGEVGPGRLADIDQLEQALYMAMGDNALAGQRWLINAGPTHEYWDDVRFLANASSGRMGFSLALAAAARGASVQLISGPDTPASPFGVEVTRVTNAAEMQAASLAMAAGADVFVATAAVGDFRFRAPVQGKIKRGDDKSLSLAMEANADIVAAVTSMKGRPGKVVAFAAEAEDHVEHARAKCERKGADAIFVNDISAMGSGQAGGWWISGKTVEEISAQPKHKLAERLIGLIGSGKLAP